MKRSLKYLALILLLAGLTAGAAQADVRLPAVFGSHMVLQQQRDVTFWGWSDVGEEVRIHVGWDTTTYKAVGTPRAQWRVVIPTPAAGGPYRITIRGRNEIVLEDVLVGEVWLASGQSNMEWSVRNGVMHPLEEDSAAASTTLRLLHVTRTASGTPQDDVQGRWQRNEAENRARFSAAAYHFGKRLQAELGVPVGLINASWGGTPAEVWTPAEVIASDPVLAEAAGRLTESPWGPVAPGATYNAMIHPLVPFEVAGVIWYQGESNVGAYGTYERLFTTLIGSWRKAWGRDFPFYFVQIAPYARYGAPLAGALLREAQTRSLALPNTGMVVVSDLVDDLDDIHPRNKRDVGLRLAAMALAQTYDRPVAPYRHPRYHSMERAGKMVRVTFDHTGGGLESRGGMPTSFEIAGEDRRFVPAQVRIDGETVLVWSDAVASPVAVRFGFTNDAVPNLFSREGLPVNLFRTDDWPTP